MNPFWMTRQVIGWQKNAFDHAFDTVAMLQDHVDKMTRATVRDMEWLPEGGKDIVEEWTGSFRKGRNEWKKMVDGQFEACTSALGQAVPNKTADSSV